MKLILLAEDDHDLGTILKQYLELNKYNVLWEQDGESAYKAFQTTTPDICILDIMMPKIDGFTLAKKIIDEAPQMPFLFLTSRTSKEDIIKGLKLGADDYVTKPFEVEELLLRITNIIKRAKQQAYADYKKLPKDPINIGNYIFDAKNLELNINDKTIKLTEKESQLIFFLYNHRNQLIKREYILTQLWKKNDFFSGRSMDVFISRVRKYFTDDDNISINSIRGIGLEFRTEKERD